jgi:hypothetical protein
VPLKLSAISISESLAPEALYLKFDAEQDELFQQELRRLEQQNSGSTKWSQMFAYSKENQFLFDILRLGCYFTILKVKHPKLLSEALLRNSQTISEAAAVWEEFTQEEYFRKGLDVPAHPLFVRIEEELGLRGVQAGVSSLKN